MGPRWNDAVLPFQILALVMLMRRRRLLLLASLEERLQLTERVQIGLAVFLLLRQRRQLLRRLRLALEAAAMLRGHRFVVLWRPVLARGAPALRTVRSTRIRVKRAAWARAQAVITARLSSVESAFVDLLPT